MLTHETSPIGGTVITKDHAVGILSKLAKHKPYTDTCLALLIDILKDCAVNQFHAYVEKTAEAMTEKHTAAFLKVLQSRLKNITQESKRKRIEKVMKKMK